MLRTQASTTAQSTHAQSTLLPHCSKTIASGWSAIIGGVCQPVQLLGQLVSCIDVFLSVVLVHVMHIFTYGVRNNCIPTYDMYVHTYLFLRCDVDSIICLALRCSAISHTPLDAYYEKMAFNYIGIIALFIQGGH